MYLKYVQCFECVYFIFVRLYLKYVQCFKCVFLQMKYEKALTQEDHIKIVCPDWVTACVAENAKIDELPYHPRLIKPPTPTPPPTPSPPPVPPTTMEVSEVCSILYQGLKFTLENSQNASRNSVLQVENIGTRKKLRVNSIFQLIPNPILVSKTLE